MNKANATFTRAFKHHQLPTLLYANRQEYGHVRIDRPMHAHNSLCELLLCYQGFGTYHVNHMSYPIQKGDLLYTNCGEVHEVVSDTSAEIGTYCFGFTDVHFPALPVNHLIPLDSPHVRPSGGRFPFLLQICKQILDNYDSNPCGQLTAQLLGTSFLMMATQIPAESQTTHVSQAESELIAQVKEFIDTHYLESLKLEDIASVFSCSVSYLCRTFKKETGYSPIQYVIRRRIGMAQTLLISSDYSATYIATLVGYDNTNYFNTLFTKVVGMTPIRYRKKYLESLYGDRSQL